MSELHDAGPAISVVSPVHNESAGLREFLERTLGALESTGLSYEVLLVDDGSTDDSWAQILAAHQEHEPVHGIQLSRNFGKESAMLAGLRAARGEAVVIMDSDLQHPPSLLPELVSAWQEGADVVEAVKRTRTGQSLPSRVSSRMFNRTFRQLTGVNLTDATDFRLLSRRTVEALLQLPERTFFFRGTSSWIGFRTEQVPFDVDPRVAGGSRWRFRSLLRYAINGITSFTAAPLHLVTLGAVLFGLFALVLGVQTIVRFLQGDAVTGFTTVILLLLIQGTLVLLGLGIVGEYLARIHDEVKRRPRFIVARSTLSEVRDRADEGPS